MDNLSKITRREFLKSAAAASLAGAGLAGCASASVPYFPSENQEEWVQKTLTGTWGGYITHPRERIGYNTPTLQIFRVEKTTNGWSIALSLNGRTVDAAELTVNEIMIRIEFVEHYANLLSHYSMTLYRDRLTGKIWYGTRSYTPAEVTFNKIQ